MESLNRSRTLCVVATLMAAASVSVYFRTIDVAVPGPTILVSGGSAIPIVTEVVGRIQKVYVTEGSFIHLGDPIIQLDTSELLLKKLALESRIDFVERHPTNARAELSSLYRELQQIQLNLSRFTITSPTDGQIMSLAAVYPGEMLRAGTAVAVAIPPRRRRL